MWIWIAVFIDLKFQICLFYHSAKSLLDFFNNISCNKRQWIFSFDFRIQKQKLLPVPFNQGYDFLLVTIDMRCKHILYWNIKEMHHTKKMMLPGKTHFNSNYILFIPIFSCNLCYWSVYVLSFYMYNELMKIQKIDFYH